MKDPTQIDALLADQPVARSIFLGVADEQEAIVWHALFGDPETLAEVDISIARYRRAEAGDDDPVAQAERAAADAALKASFQRAARLATN
jgi:hypothetical protein